VGKNVLRDNMATPEEIEKLRKAAEKALREWELAEKEFKEISKAYKEARKKLNETSRAANIAGKAYYDAMTTAALEGYKWWKKSDDSIK